MARSARPSSTGLPRAVWNFTVLLILPYITDLTVFVSISLKAPWSISQIKQRQSSCMVNTNQSGDAALELWAGPESPTQQGGGFMDSGWFYSRFTQVIYNCLPCNHLIVCFKQNECFSLVFLLTRWIAGVLSTPLVRYYHFQLSYTAMASRKPNDGVININKQRPNIGV